MKIKHLIAGMLASAALFACTEKTPQPEPTPDPALDVPTKELSVESVAGKASFTITANQDWTATPSADWLTLSPASGTASEEAATVQVTAEDNPDEAERTATVLVKAGGLEATVKVTQAAKVVVEDGTEANPYRIKTVEDLQAMRANASLETPTYFRLENDIDMAAVENWVPVNFDSDYARQIHFDGNGKTLSNFAPKTWNTENLDGETVVALYPSFFGVLYGSCKNLTITNAKIEDAASTPGILAGYVGTTDKPATVSNVSVQGSVSSTTNKAGGMAGVAYSSTFTDCSADVTVTTSSTDAGGFVGQVLGTSSFTNCKVKVALVSKGLEKLRCGGFIGWNRATATTIENCHVLEGSTITDESGRTEGKITSYGGFIGFGDSDAVPTKLTVKNSSAKIDINTGDFAQVNSCFIGTVGYSAEVLLENCSAEGDVVAGPNPQNYAGGLFARIQNVGIDGVDEPRKVTLKNCNYNGNVKGRAGVGGLVGAAEGGEVIITDSHAKGTVTNIQNNIGGLVGLVTSSVAIDGCSFEGDINGAGYVGGAVGGVQSAVTKCELTKTSVAGTVVASGNYAGGFIGAAQGAGQVINNCYSSASVTAVNAKQVGGLVGTSTSVITITNSYAAGNVATKTVAGGIIGRVGAADSKVSNCIAWNSEVSASASSLVGAVIGSLEKSGDYSACIRRSDMVLTVASAQQTAADQDDITAVSAAGAYHGKAAAADATASSVAKTLGWDESVWDLSGDLPKLK